MNGTYGRAATGLSGNTTWAVSQGAAKAGARGETSSADILDTFSGRAAVLHDLRVPIPNFTSNIDHVVVSGNRVLVLDSKVWKPGFYWTLFGKNRRGAERVDHTAKSPAYMSDALRRYLSSTGAEVSSPVLVIWCSRPTQKAHTWLLNVPGAQIISGSALTRTVRSFIGRKPADPAIVRKLSSLLVTPPATSRPSIQLGEDPFAA